MLTGFTRSREGLVYDLVVAWVFLILPKAFAE